jgi:hypothetical protein
MSSIVKRRRSSVSQTTDCNFAGQFFGWQLIHPQQAAVASHTSGESFLTKIHKCCKYAPSSATTWATIKPPKRLGSSGRKFESCRTDHLKTAAWETPERLFFRLRYKAGGLESEGRGESRQVCHPRRSPRPCCLLTGLASLPAQLPGSPPFMGGVGGG